MVGAMLVCEGIVGAEGTWAAGGVIVWPVELCPPMAFRMLWTSGLVCAYVPEGPMAQNASTRTAATRIAAAQSFLTNITPALSEWPVPENPMASGFYSGAASASSGSPQVIGAARNGPRAQQGPASN